MKNKKILTLILSICMLSAAGCNTASADVNTDTQNTTAITEQAVDEGVYYASSDNVKQLGRTYYDDNNTLWCALSGSGIEFEYTGTKAEITIIGDSSVSAGNFDGNPRVAIYVDGERVIDDMLNKSERTYTVAENNTSKTSTIKVIKLSEAANSTFGISNIKIDTDESITPTPSKDMLIEFIGDSITCGYGVDDEVKENHFSTKTEDITKTYAFKTAEALNADYSMVSFSGYGIISGYSGDGKKVESQQLPKYYSKTGHSYGNMNGKQISSIEWDFSKREPNIIVINLGTNDDTYCKDEEKKNEFSTAYIDFLKQVREKNPNAKIICTLGIMGGNLYPYIELAVSTYTSESGDTNVTSMLFASQNMADGIAADWHPSDKTHTIASEKLVNELISLGWVVK